MIAINLLDWRSKNITIQNTRFYVVTTAVVSICFVFSLSSIFIINNMIVTIKKDIAYLNTELFVVDGKIKDIKDLQEKKSVLLSRRQVIESLQANRSLAVIIFDNLIRAVPDGVVLTSLSRKGNELALDGNSDSNYNITVFIENMQKLSWVKTANLSEIKTYATSEDDNSQISFQLTVTINADA